jgi:hypothetical protein
MQREANLKLYREEIMPVVLIPLDTSEGSAIAIEPALALASVDTEYVLLHVADDG